MIRLFILVLASTCPCEENLGIDDLTGLWQANTCIGSDLSDVWFFMPDGAFLFRESSMNGSERLREYSGTFDVFGDTLRLTVTGEIIEEGGRMELNEGSTSIGGDSILVGSVETVRTLDPPDTRNLIIESLRLETMDENQELPDDLMRIDLNGETYWRFASDPESASELLGT